MKNIVRFVIAFMLLAGCMQVVKTTPDIKVVRDTSIKTVKKEVIEKENVFLKMSNDSLWYHLAFKKEGCLTGGQYVKNGKIGNPGCVITIEQEWETFTKRNKDSLTNFLITKFSETKETLVHTCPFFEATEGELAVYVLQALYVKNWFDFKDFKKYKDKETTSAKDNRQTWLQNILKKKRTRKKMIAYWKAALKKSKH